MKYRVGKRVGGATRPQEVKTSQRRKRPTNKRSPLTGRRKGSAVKKDGMPNYGGNFHIRALGRAWSQIKEGSLTHLVTTLIIALSLTIYAIVALVIANANTALTEWRGDNRITVFLQSTASRSQRLAVLKRLSDHPLAGPAAAVTPETALKRLKEMLGTDAGLLDELEENPLPHSLEFTPTRDDPAAASSLAENAARWPGVESVAYDRKWADRLEAIVETAQYGGYVFSALLLTAVALIISNTIKLTIMARRDEVEVMRFMGATDSFIKTPFIYEGMLQGLLGAGASLLLTTLLFLGARSAAADLGAAFGLTLHLHHLPGEQFALIVGLGVLLGLAGALISISRFLKV